MRISVVGAHKTGTKAGVPNPSAGEWNDLSPMAHGIDVCHWCVECFFFLFLFASTHACHLRASPKGVWHASHQVCVCGFSSVLSYTWYVFFNHGRLRG